MFYAVATVLVLLWLIGMLTSHIAGGFIHLLLIIAIVVVLFGIRQGRFIFRFFKAH
ncbi:MAG: lmo0937 family membrane protein [Chitinispirillaceae bacterium]|nr:lmo0937 family membrane protein [Chitinispirillaceae bacterium]